MTGPSVPEGNRHSRTVGTRWNDDDVYGQFVHVCVDADNQRPVPIPSRLGASIEAEQVMTA